MLKSIRTTMKLDREKVRIPRRVQDAIPVKAVYEDGIFQLAKNKYSKSWKFTDINYDVLSDEERIETIKSYGVLLNSFESSATTKITIHNRRISQKDFGERILLEEKDDGMNRYRREYNEMLQAKAAGNNAILQEKYITVSVHKNSLEEARGFFRRAGTELASRLGKLGSRCQELDGLERLQILHSFYRVGEEDHFHFDLKDCRRKGHSFKDYICPDSMEFARDHFRMGQRFGRCLFIKDVAAYLKDTLVAELTSMNQNMMLSIDILPVPMAEAIREAENRLLGVSTNITTWQRKQNANNNFGAIIPYDMEQQLADSKEFLDDLTIRDQQMMLALITIVHTADSKKQLDADTESLKSMIQTRHCQMGILRFQQLDGLNTVLPAGQRKIDALRTFTTESLSAFMPFHVQEISHDHGIYYGQNVISKNMIIADRRQLLNGNSFILGVSGSGKSFTAKSEIINFAMATDEGERNDAINHGTIKGKSSGNRPIPGSVADTVSSRMLCRRFFYGYIRICSGFHEGSHLDRQIEALQEYEIPEGNIFADRQSGKNFERPDYRKLMRKLKKGNLLIIKSIDRLGRNYDEILEQWRVITRVKEVDILVIDFPLLDTRKRGVHFGPKRKELPAGFELARKNYISGIMSVRQAAGSCDMSYSTFYK